MHKHLFGSCTCQDTGGTKHLFDKLEPGAALTEPLKLILLTFTDDMYTSPGESDSSKVWVWGSAGTLHTMAGSKVGFLLLEC